MLESRAVRGTGNGARGAAAALLLLAAACWRGEPPPPPQPVAPPGTTLVYAPAPETAHTYAMADTVTLTFSGGALSNVRIEGGYHATVQVRYERVDDELRVTAGVSDFSGELRNPMAGTTRATEEDVQGEWVVRLGPRGTTERVARATVTSRFSDVVGTDDLLRNFFVRLPPEPVRRGAPWTDTIRVTEETPTGVESSTSIVTSTWAGDTLVGERSLRIIRTTTETTLRIESTSDGTQVVQSLAGGTTALSLFDSERGILVSSREQGVLSGTLDVPAAGLNQIPLTARVRRHLVLRPG